MHRSVADLEATGMRLATAPDGGEEVLGYDKLIVGTGAVPIATRRIWACY